MTNSTHKKGFIPVLMVVLILVLLVGSLLFVKWFFSPVHTNIRIPKVYTFNWDKNTKVAKLVFDKEQLLDFKLNEEPLQVIYEPKNKVLALVTKEKLESPWNIYIYSSDRGLRLIHSGQLMSYTSVLRDIPTHARMKGFSPDGKYLLANTSGYEWSLPLIVSIEDSKKIFDPNPHDPSDLSGFDLVFFDPQKECFLNILEAGIGPRIDLIKLTDNFPFTELVDENATILKNLDTNVNPFRVHSPRLAAFLV